MRLARALLITAVASTTVAVTTHAQDTATAASARPARTQVCYRGRPLPKCDVFILTDLTLQGRVVRPQAKFRYLSYDSTTREESIRPNSYVLSLELGGMKNLNEKNAAGLTAIFDLDGDEFNVGIKTRYRRWLDASGLALDLGAGFVTRNSIEIIQQPGYYYYSTGSRDKTVYLTGDVAVNVQDYVSIITRVDVGKYDRRLQPAVGVGARLGSLPAAITTGAIATTYGVLFTLLIIALGSD